jgi:hypothetical protein
MVLERFERTSDSPMAIDKTGSLQVPAVRPRWTDRIPAAWLGMWGYLVAGVMLGLVLIATITIARNTAAATMPPGTITDTVTRVDQSQLDPACFAGLDGAAGAPARLTVSLEIGLDGKVRYAAAAGTTPRLRSCVEAYVQKWEFLPQARPQTMVLPFEVTRR